MLIHWRVLLVSGIHDFWEVFFVHLNLDVLILTVHEDSSNHLLFELGAFQCSFLPPKKRPISILDIFSNNQKMVDPRILTKKYILANPQKTLAEKESGIELYARYMLQTGKKLQWINGVCRKLSVLMSCFKSVESWGTKLREKNTFNLGNLWIDITMVTDDHWTYWVNHWVETNFLVLWLKK